MSLAKDGLKIIKSLTPNPSQQVNKEKQSDLTRKKIEILFLISHLPDYLRTTYKKLWDKYEKVNFNPVELITLN
jgi:hypothetical protein